MHSRELERQRPSHDFSSSAASHAERRTWLVIVLTVITMGIEIGGGFAFGSMALLADGWHMGTHAAAFGITAFAYSYARKHANNPRFTFGTGKVTALGGFASAIALLVAAALMIVESVERMLEPVSIRFDEAIGVAVFGLLVNLVCAYLLGGHHHDDHAHHDHAHHDHAHHDHNLRAAYMHVLADALTSVLAIAALLAGRFAGLSGLDPLMGVVGAVVITKWSFNLMRETSRVLLDAEVDPKIVDSVREAVEKDGDNRVADLHVWRVGPHHLAGVMTVVTHDPKPPGHYKNLVDSHGDLVHLTVEVHRCHDDDCA